jgi:hypothetical protein
LKEWLPSLGDLKKFSEVSQSPAIFPSTSLKESLTRSSLAEEDESKGSNPLISTRMQPVSTRRLARPAKRAKPSAPRE